MVLMEEVLSELSGEDKNEQGFPQGFRFHPTDEELITFYLASKVFKGSSSGVDIAEVDLNRCEPWELPDVAKMGEREWYFFSLRDRKYPTGIRTNRATGAGYWKATGKDKEVDSGSTGALLGMKKTLVFYRGRAPRGEKTRWVMHKYRLDGHFSHRHTCKEEWVICRIFHKNREKRSQGFHGQVNSFPPLLETSTTLLNRESQTVGQCLDQNQQESELKSHLFPMSYGFQFHQPSFSTSPPSMAAAVSNNLSPSLLPWSIFKTLLSHQPSKIDSENQPLLFEMDSDTSASIPFNRAGFQIKLHAESWSLDV